MSVNLSIKNVPDQPMMQVIFCSPQNSRVNWSPLTLKCIGLRKVIDAK